jgi:hypothetical protein
MTKLTIGQRLDLFLSHVRLRRAAIGAALVSVGLVAGTLIPPPHAALGEVTPTAPAQNFKSGDLVAVPILREIAGTLHTIDGRLSRLETVFKELTRPQPRPVSAN